MHTVLNCSQAHVSVCNIKVCSLSMLAKLYREEENQQDIPFWSVNQPADGDMHTGIIVKLVLFQQLYCSC